MPLGKIIKTGSEPRSRPYQACLLIRQEGLNEEKLWRILDPETNNVLADGLNDEFLYHEIGVGRLELELGWERD